MKIRPLGNYLLVQVEVVSETRGGIVIPEQFRKIPQKGKVVAIGVGVKNPQIKVGDVVLFPNYAGSRVPDDDTLVLVEATEDALALVEE
jgi:chaperonin GroES